MTTVIGLFFLLQHETAPNTPMPDDTQESSKANQLAITNPALQRIHPQVSQATQAMLRQTC
ncbi:hypothetical protein N9B17_00515 [Rhodopirellula sp.]|nr:hypothetical protein [Rhodopirellula sp.]